MCNKPFLFMLFLCLCDVALCDDTALYVEPLERRNIEVLFLVDAFAATRCVSPYPEERLLKDCPSKGLGRATQIKHVLHELLSSANTFPRNVSVGLAEFTPHGAVISVPIADLGNRELSGQRSALLKRINALSRNEPPATLYAMLEVAHYLTAGSVLFGEAGTFVMQGRPEGQGMHYQYTVNEDTSSCVKNKVERHVVVLTSGNRADQSASLRIKGFTVGEWVNAFANAGNTPIRTGYDSQCPVTAETTEGLESLIGGVAQNSAAQLMQCVELIAKTLNTQHQVVTHVIDFSGEDKRKQWAASGGGQYIEPVTGNDLRVFLSNFMRNPGVVGEPVSGAVSVPLNQLTPFSHSNEIYYSVFQPSGRSYWYGNVKRYELDKKGAGLRILSYTAGAESELAVIPCKKIGIEEYANCFSHGRANNQRARSWWNDTSVADGNIVTQGGAASHQAAFGKRNIYIQASPSKLRRMDEELTGGFEVDSLLPGSSSYLLRQALLANHLNIDSSTVTLEDWKSASASVKSQIAEQILWFLGSDPISDTNPSVGKEYSRLLEHKSESLAPQVSAGQQYSRQFYGAPLHSRPLVVNYDKSAKGGRSVLFMSTSSGFLRVIDSSSGKELSAIFPKALIKHIPEYLSQSSGPLLHGLDGQWSVWRQDGDGDGKIDPNSADDFVYIYGGMRRGGRSLYAFDVTDPEQPAMLFELSPESHSSLSTVGQIWSKPTLAWIRVPGEANPVAVLIVGGGYDSSYDKQHNSAGAYGGGFSEGFGEGFSGADKCAALTVQCGNQIYMVLAQKQAGSYRAGDVVWWTSSAAQSDLLNLDMTDSVVGRIRTLDEDGDGYFDRFYGLDIRGRVFVYSFPEKSMEETDLRTVDDLTVRVLATLGLGDSQPRLFYDGPGLTVGRDEHGEYSMLASGSGWRANPQSQASNDAFFIIKDRPGGARKVPLRGSDLALMGAPLFNRSNLLNGLTMVLSPNGEKVFGSPLITGGKIFFTTYTPRDSSEACRPGGRVALYAIDIATGLGLFNHSGELAAPHVENAFALRNLGLSSLGDIQGFMLGNKIQLLSGGRFFGSFEQPRNLVHPLSWHEVARGKDVYRLFPAEIEK